MMVLNFKARTPFLSKYRTSDMQEMNNFFFGFTFVPNYTTGDPRYVLNMPSATSIGNKIYFNGVSSQVSGSDSTLGRFPWLT